VAEAVRLYLVLARAEYRSARQHRASFALLGAASTVTVALDFVVIAFLLQRIPRLAGFSLAQLGVLYGLASLAERLADLAVGDVEKVSLQVKDGTFDRVLLRPGPALVQVAASSCRPQMLGRPLQAAVVLVIALNRAGVDWTWDRVVLLPATIACGTLIFIAVWVAGAALTFATVDGREAMNAFTYGGGFLAQYPLSIYSSWFRQLFTYVLPIAFVSWFPALHLLGIADPLGLPAWFRFAPPLAAAAALTVATAAWRTALRRYRSTGS
jgi:ABC-2 type transport system permease protein